MSQALNDPSCPYKDSAVIYFYIGIIRQKYRELQPMISNVMGFDTCVMVSALEKFVKLETNNDERVKTVNCVLDL